MALSSITIANNAIDLVPKIWSQARMINSNFWSSAKKELATFGTRLKVLIMEMKTRERQENAMETRSVTRGDLTEVGRSTRANTSFMCDAAKVWNKAPEKIRTSKTLTTAIKAIRDHCKSLPI